jgi:hypothetical protein
VPPLRVCVRTILSPRWGLLLYHFFTQGLRPGLHSFAASRLKSGPSFHCGDVHCSSHAPSSGLGLGGPISPLRLELGSHAYSIGSFAVTKS